MKRTQSFLTRIAGSIVFLLLLSFSAAGQDGKQVPFFQVAQHAVEQSQITLAGSTPFHLKAHIAQAGNSNGDYTADVEEYWVSPTRWRRTIQSSNFSQILIVNGEANSEQDTGDYYPFWLRDLVTAIFNPLPMLQQLKSFHDVIDVPTDSAQSNSCLNMNVPSGVAPVKTTISYAFCFQGRGGRLQYVLTPGYRAHFEDYKPFQAHSVARQITFDPEPQTRIQAHIVELTELRNPDESLFTVPANAAAAELKSQQVGEPTARSILLSSPEIAWPEVREGKTQGILSVYISADKTGQVREVWPLTSANPDLVRAAREQMLQWHFKPYVNGISMQMESVLTFPFDAKQGPPIPVLSDAEARKLAIHIVEPRFGKQQAATSHFVLRAVVDEQGKLLEVRNPNQVKTGLFQAGETALRQWQFRPYVHDGRPDRFYADVSFGGKSSPQSAAAHKN
jgi:hypothetical protein